MKWDGLSNQDNNNNRRVEPVFIISPKRKSGLILYQDYHGEFLGPGSAIASYEKCQELVFINSPVLIPVTNAQDYYEAYQTRIEWLNWLRKITRFSSNPFSRSEKLLSSLEVFFGVETAEALTNEVLAQLIGVLPKTVAQVRQLRRRRSPIALKEVSYWQPINFNQAFEVHTLKCPQRHSDPSLLVNC